MLIKPYEISIWQDKYVNNNLTENKIAIIGSNTMTSQCRAMNPELKQKTNGETSLSFEMLAVYYDNITGEKIKNPFITYLQSERKVKLNYDGKWYDFLVKSISEDSTKMIFSYQLENAFVVELSRNGFGVTLDAELNNNIGTIKELGEKVLEGSGWTIGNSDVCVQTIEEALVPLEVATTFVSYGFKDPILNNNGIYTGVNKDSSATIISKGKQIFAFYSDYKNYLEYYKYMNKDIFTESTLLKEEADNLGNLKFNFIYIEDLGAITKDDNRIITNEDCTYQTSGTISNLYDFSVFYKHDYEISKNIVTATVSEDFRGKKYVFSEVQKYFPKLKAYGTLYNGTVGTESPSDLWAITETEYVSPTLVENLVTNDTFTSTAGWYGYKAGTSLYNEGVEAQAYRTVNGIVTTTSLIDDYRNGEFKTEYSYTPALYTSKNCWLINTGFYDNKNKIKEIIKGDKFILRFSCRNNNSTSFYSKFNSAAGLKSVKIQDVIYNTTTKSFEVKQHDNLSDLLNFNGQPQETIIDGKTVAYYIAKAQYSLNERQLKDSSLKIFCDISDTIHQMFEFEIFRYKEDAEGNIIFPISSKVYTSDSDLQIINNFSNVKTLTHYCYFTQENYELCTSREDLVLKEKSLIKKTPVIRTDAQQVRAITAKESNYFNNIQTLAETFEMWPQIKVEHDDVGKIIGDKQIIFRKYIGQDNYAGFRYGVNLGTIKRTIDSKQITSKLIVKQNSNEFGKNGFCTIARANSNELKENFMYDFQYYANKGLLSLVDLEKELYTNFEFQGNNQIAMSWGGYYPQTMYYNRMIENYNEKRLPYERTLQELKSQQQLCVNGINEAERSYLQALNDFENNTGFSLMDNKEAADVIKNSDLLQKYLLEICEYQTEMKEYQSRLKKVEKSLEITQKQIQELNNQVEELTKSKKLGHEAFQKKYASFIQEGTWIDEKYMDDELYYADAQSVLYNSVFPKITYSINVLEVSQLEDLESFKYDLGDRTFIEDIEFFGYNEEGYPYRESVVVTEISNKLDDPSKNSIQIQNYKTQFQDLFQRITATVQSVQYSEGSYDKATSFVNGDANKKWQTIRDALNNASNTILQNGNNHSVTWDERGIVVTNLLKPSQQVWIQGGAISISTLNDRGEQEWKTAIDGKGISASYLKAGSIDTSLIQIMSGTMPTFRWDSYGITAFTDEANKGVRFDKYGVYGYSSDDNYFKPKDINDVLDKSRFYLGWDGLQIKSSTGANVFIGKQKYADGTDYRLIQIKDSSGKETFSVTSDGTVNVATGIQVGSNIGEWTTDGKGLVYNSDTAKGVSFLYGGTGANIYDDDGKLLYGGIVFKAGNNFYVNASGKLYATGAEISGTIKAEKGEIGGWTIDSNYLSATQGSSVFVISGPESSGNTDDYWIRAQRDGYLKFYVSKIGKLYAKGADIEGKITATEGVFSKCTIDETCTIKGNLTGSVFTDLHTPSDGHEVQGYLTINYANMEYEAVELKIGVKEFTEVQRREAYIYLENIELDGGMTLNAGVIQIGEDYTNLLLYGEFIKLITQELHLGSENAEIYIKGTQWTDSLSVGDSDLNLKNTITSLSSSYSTLFDSLHPVTYKYNNGTSDRLHIGFIAQEVDEAISVAGLTRQDFAGLCILNEDAEDERWGLRYGEFVALNTSEIQKLKARVAELEQKLKEISK